MSKPYATKLDEVIRHLTEGGIDTNIDLLKEREKRRRAAIVVVAGNRGLCGGFNTKIVELALDQKEKLQKEGVSEVRLYVFGKKAYNYLRFFKEPVYKTGVNPEDKVGFQMASDLGSELVESFEKHEIDEVYFVYTQVKTVTSQKPAVMRLLPITQEVHTEEEKVSSAGDYIFDPNPEEILSNLIPLYIKVKIFSTFLESNFSEQFARRVAMKNANDAAEDMVKDLTVFYNRVRQAKITNEIAEIVGGAAALE